MTYQIRIWEVWKASKINRTPYCTWSWLFTDILGEDPITIAEGENYTTEELAREGAEKAATLYWHQQQMVSYTYDFDPSTVVNKPVEKIEGE